MNNYLKLALITAMYTIISIYYEKKFDTELVMKPNTFFINVFLRFVHSFVTVYQCLFLLFFYNTKNQIHYQIFLFTVFMMIFMWTIFDSCILCLIEWDFYEGDKYSRDNTDVLHLKLLPRVIYDTLFFATLFSVLYLVKVDIKYKLLYFFILGSIFVIAPRNTKFAPIDPIKSIHTNYSPTNIYNNFQRLIKGEATIEGFF